MKTGDYVKLKEPEWTDAINQGERPAGMRFDINGEKFVIPWGTVLKVSEGCSNGVYREVKNSQYNYIDAAYVKANPEMFAEIKKRKPKKET